MKVNYWVVKYIDDLFANEPINIGIFVEIDNVVTARFIGESKSDNELNVQGLEWLYPQIYKQWVVFWRKKLKENDFDAVDIYNWSNYKVVPGGNISGMESLKPEDVLDYLYCKFVTKDREVVHIDIPFCESNFQTTVFDDYSLTPHRHYRHLLLKQDNLLEAIEKNSNNGKEKLMNDAQAKLKIIESELSKVEPIVEYLEKFDITFEKAEPWYFARKFEQYLLVGKFLKDNNLPTDQAYIETFLATLKVLPHVKSNLLNQLGLETIIVFDKLITKEDALKNCMRYLS